MRPVPLPFSGFQLEYCKLFNSNKCDAHLKIEVVYDKKNIRHLQVRFLDVDKKSKENFKTFVLNFMAVFYY
jgi:hypothetical protein